MVAVEEVEPSSRPFGLVLIVEDDLLVRRALVELMRSHADRIVEARGVDGALRVLRTEDVHLVLLDVRLGRGSGVDVARFAATRVPAPAVVAISGSASAKEGFELAHYGVRAYMAKAELAERMDEIVALAHDAPRLDPLLKAQVGVRSVRELQESVRDLMLDQALALEDGNLARAAKRLGVTRQAVQQMMRRRYKPD